MTTRNVPLLRQVLGHIEAHPEQHDQGAWGYRNPECGTTHCFAGWTIALGMPDARFNWTPTALYKEPPSYGADAVILPGQTEATSVYRVARDLLGLNYEDADRLFLDADSLDDLRRIVGELCDGAPT